MPLTKIPFKPGVVREITDYANEGGYYYSDLIRFRMDFVEKIGGWANTSPDFTFNGVVRSLVNWNTLNSENLIGFGTTQQYYVQNGINTAYHDITPIAGTKALVNPFSTTTGSPLVTVNSPAHGLALGGIVYFSGSGTSVTVGGVTIYFGSQSTGNEYQVVNVLNADIYQIVGSGNATSYTTGGGSITATYLINCSSSATITDYGWGLGTWGTGLWGIGSGITTTYNHRVWSQATFGQDLMMSILGNPIYYWVKDTSAYSPAVPLSEYATTQNFGNATVLTGNTPGSNTFNVVFADYVYPGELVTWGQTPPAGGSIPSNTYVVSVVGLEITVTNPVTIPDGSVLNFSYSREYVPVTTNKVFVSPIYQFAIVLGSNPYDPVLGSGSTYNPLLIRWSDQANPAQWIPLTTNQSGEQAVANGSKLMTAVNNRQEILVYTDTAIYSMQYVGAPYVYSFTLLQDNISLISQNAALTANNVTWWMGIDKFYMYNGSVQVIPCPLRRYVFSNINRDAAWQIVVGYNEGFSEIWWFYPSKNSTVNDSYVKFNFQNNVWDYGSLNRTAWFGSGLQQYPLAAFSVDNTFLAGNLDATTTSITVLDASTYPQMGVLQIDDEYIVYTGISANTFTGCIRGAFGSTATTHQVLSDFDYVVPNQIMYHEFGIDDNSIPGVTLPVMSFIQSSDVGIGDGHNLASVWRMVPDLTFTNSTSANPTVTMTVYPRLNSGSPYSQPPTPGVDQPTVVETVPPPPPPAVYPVEQFTGQIYTRVRGRQMAFRMDTGNVNDTNLIFGYPRSALGTMWQLGMMRFDLRPDGRR
jgi:hypothetical protein